MSRMSHSCKSYSSSRSIRSGLKQTGLMGGGTHFSLNTLKNKRNSLEYTRKHTGHLSAVSAADLVKLLKLKCLNIHVENFTFADVLQACSKHLPSALIVKFADENGEFQIKNTLEFICMTSTHNAI